MADTERRSRNIWAAGPLPSETWHIFLANDAQLLMAAEFVVVPAMTGRLLVVSIRIELLGGTGSSCEPNCSERVRRLPRSFLVWLSFPPCLSSQSTAVYICSNAVASTA